MTVPEAVADFDARPVNDAVGVCRGGKEVVGDVVEVTVEREAETIVTLEVPEEDSVPVELRERVTEVAEAVREFDDVAAERENDCEEIVAKLRDTVTVRDCVAVTVRGTDSESELVAVVETEDDDNRVTVKVDDG